MSYLLVPFSFKQVLQEVILYRDRGESNDIPIQGLVAT